MTHEVLARARSDRGEVVVRRRDGDVLELRVNGVFVMDTAETSSERMLASAAMAGLTGLAAPLRVLVGGLGLGYTVRDLLSDRRVGQVVVGEIEEVVVDWMNQGLLPGGDVLKDPRVEVVTGDIRHLVRPVGRSNRPGHRGYDVILLDVDNGPDNLVYDGNADLYQEAFLADCRRALESPGRLAVWSGHDAPPLAAAIETVFGACRAQAVDVDLQGRAEQYWLFTGETVGEPLTSGSIASRS